MINILKAEFNKLLKGKVIYILMISIIVIPLFSAGLYKIASFLDGGDMIVDLLSSFEMFKQSFNPVNNFGLLLLIMIIVISSSDFSNNTVRNKIVGGFNKTEIYLSSLIQSFILVFVFMTLYALFTVLFLGLLIGFSNNIFKDYLLVYLINMSSIITIYSIINMLLFVFKSFGKTLGIALAFIFSTLIIYSIFMFTMSLNTNKTLVTIIPFINVFYSNLFSTGRTISIVIVNIGYTIATTLLGIHLNKNLDYK